MSTKPRKKKTESPDLKRNKKTTVRTAGVVDIVEADNIDVSALLLNKSSLHEILISVVTEQGFTVLSKEYLKSNESTLIVMQEGYVAARPSWPEYSHCSLDLWLWGSQEKSEQLRNALLQKLDAKKFSSYRIAVGGMLGTGDPIRDLTDRSSSQIGSCDATANTSKSTIDDKSLSSDAMTIIVDDVWSHAINLSSVFFGPSLTENELLFLVICGAEGSDCLSHQQVKHTSQSHVGTFWTCNNDFDTIESTAEGASKLYKEMIACENELLGFLHRNTVLQDRKIDVLIVDQATPVTMLQILNSVLAPTHNREKFLSFSHVLMTITEMPLISAERDDSASNGKNHDIDKKQTKLSQTRNFLDRYRRTESKAPISRAEVYSNDKR